MLLMFDLKLSLATNQRFSTPEWLSPMLLALYSYAFEYPKPCGERGMQLNATVSVNNVLRITALGYAQAMTIMIMRIRGCRVPRGHK